MVARGTTSLVQGGGVARYNTICHGCQGSNKHIPRAGGVATTQCFMVVRSVTSLVQGGVVVATTQSVMVVKGVTSLQ